jgi:hypothetical protein
MIAENDTFNFSPPRWVWFVRFLSALIPVNLLWGISTEFAQVNTNGVFLFIITATVSTLWIYWLVRALKPSLRTVLASRSRIARIDGQRFVVETTWRYPNFVPLFLRDAELVRWFSTKELLLPEWVGRSLYLDLSLLDANSLESEKGKVKIAAGSEARRLSDWLSRKGISILEPK